MLTFGYGSNMCYGRMRFRVSHAERIAVASLLGYSFRFHKRSKKDGSAKADAFRTSNNNDVVWGVIFDVPPNEKTALDEAEGLGHGYVEETVRVNDPAGQQYETLIYVAEASAIDPDLRPYTWYRRHVTEGARHWAIDPEYVASIEAVPAADDPDVRRARCELLFPAGRELTPEERAFRDRNECVRYE
jgi:hypothetical protein